MTSIYVYILHSTNLVKSVLLIQIGEQTIEIK